MFSSALLAFSAVLLAQSAVASSCTRSYVIQEGDICDTISAAKNVSTYQLATVNYGTVDSTCGNLVPGNTICLGTVAAEDCSTTTVVQKDDSCDLIQNRVGVNSTILYLNNPQINEDCSNIYIGEVLCAAKNVQVPPAPAGAIPATSIPATATAARPTPSTATAAPPTPSTATAARPTPSTATAARPTPSTATAARPTPSTAASGSATSVLVSSSHVLPTTHLAIASTSAAAVTPAPSSTKSTAAPVPTSSAAADEGDDCDDEDEGDDTDDEDLPYCDELEE